MRHLDEMLYFVTPCLSALDIHYALQFHVLCGHLKNRLDLLRGQKAVYQDFDTVLLVMKDYYGEAEATKTEAQKIAEEKAKFITKEKTLQGLPQNEKNFFEKVLRCFGGRIVSENR